MDEKQLIAAVAKSMHGYHNPEYFHCPPELEKEFKRLMEEDKKFKDIFTPAGLMSLFAKEKRNG